MTHTRSFFFPLLAAVLLALASCQNTAQMVSESPAYEAGASRVLADMRKSEIKDLRYQLFFDLPAARRESVRGEETVRLRLEEPTEVVLDFKAAPGAIQRVEVNGDSAEYLFRNEHLIIPQSETRGGENAIHIRFIAGDQSLNRRDDYMYTLLVPDRARTLFPCFDQPNMKATFTLELSMPQAWQAVSNTYVTHTAERSGRKRVSFAPTEPLSTYLFAFSAGRMERKEYEEGGRKIAAYYRETNPDKVAQLDTIFKQVCAALRWQEEYTGIPYPFAKYDIVILPGFQFGGMEHTGATFYNDNQLFLNKHATPDEELARTQLIAHETSHMWFGDLVTMDWFDDVWTKEVFANYFAACIAEPQFPDLNHSVNWMKTYAASALSEDRTPGNTAIRQPLDNLRDAGLIYNQVVYNKAPVMMRKIVELMGEDAFREGIREYLRTYAYGNATWDDLVDILDAKTDKDLKAFSEVWVNQKGMPQIRLALHGNLFTVSQADPYGRGLTWPQTFLVEARGERDTTLTIDMADSAEVTVTLPFKPNYLLPNTDGRGYGLFIPDSASLSWMTLHWQEERDDTKRQALLMTLNEDYQARLLSDEEWTASLLRGLRAERNPLVASSALGYLPMPLRLLGEEKRATVEAALSDLADSHPLVSCRTSLWRTLAAEASCPATVARLLELWERHDSPLLGETDYTTLSYELAIRLPARSGEILSAQRSRLSDPDRLRQFDFISRAAVADTVQLDSLFRSLLQAENRRTEPWVNAALRYLCHPARGNYPVKYVRPALDILPEVQRTGDIFFPRGWAGALLSRRTDRATYEQVRTFLDDNPAFPPLLRSKVLQAAYPLFRLYQAETR